MTVTATVKHRQDAARVESGPVKAATREKEAANPVEKISAKDKEMLTRGELYEKIEHLDGVVHGGRLAMWGTGLGAGISFAAGFVIPGFFVVSAILVAACALNYFTLQSNKRNLEKAKAELLEMLPPLKELQRLRGNE